MDFLKKLMGYFNPTSFFKKSENLNSSLKFMHGTNRLSIWMMLIAVLVMIYRYCLK